MPPAPVPPAQLGREGGLSFLSPPGLPTLWLDWGDWPSRNYATEVGSRGGQEIQDLETLTAAGLASSVEEPGSRLEPCGLSPHGS